MTALAGDDGGDSSGAPAFGVREAPNASHITGLLRDQADSRPDAVALITPEDRWTYAEWLTEAERVAAALASDGVGPGDTVALLAPNRLEWLAVVFGCATVGARVAPFNTWVKGPELAFLLGFARPTVLVVVDRWARQDFLAELGDVLPDVWAGDGRPSSLPSLRRVVVLGEDAPPGATLYRDWLRTEHRSQEPVVPPDGIAMVLFTSGSTARPKGVALAHADLIGNGFEIGERQGIGPDDRLLLVSPLFWSLGAANALFATLTHGTCLVLLPQFEAAAALETIERERCTAIYTLSAITHALLDHPEFSPARVATLERGLTFGPPVEMRLVMEGLGIGSICNIYGSTEVYGNCAVSPWDAPAERRTVASGPPLGGVEIRIVDPDTGAARATGEVGEIQVRGRVSPGYLTDDGSLAPVANPEGWYRTGDLGSLDDEGWVGFAGRSSEMIKTSGINVSPAEVEAVLVEHDDVVAAAVTGLAHPVRGEEVVALIKPRAGADVEPAVLRDWAKQRVASYKVPSRILVVNEFPTTSTGKLARRELPALVEATVADLTAPDTTAPGNWGRWGDTDEAGAGNLIGAAEVLAGMGLARQGKVVKLGMNLGPATAVPSHRKRPERFMTRDGGDYAAGARRPGGFQFAEEVWSFAAHSGTHVDALAHAWADDQLYNGFPGQGTRSTTGAQRCGADKLLPMITRGLLIDLAGGGPALGPTESVSAGRLQAACAAIGVIPQAGDVVLIRTGWLTEAGGEPSRYFHSEPGIDASAAIWLAGVDVAAVGADNYAVEVQPSEEGTMFPVHEILIRDHGVPLFEGVVLDELASEGATKFCFIASPLSLVGGTASPVCPLAVL